MARTRYTQGQSINDLLKIRPGAFRDLPKAHQREIISKLASAGNKRLRGLEQKGIENAVKMRVEMSGGKFSTKGKDTEGLLKELTRAKRFLQSDQSTVKGWKETQKKLQSDLENAGITTTPKTGLAYSVYDLLRDYNQDLITERMKYEVTERIEDDLREGLDPNQAYQNAQNWLFGEYRKNQRDYESLQDEFDETPTRYKRRYRRR